MLTLLFLYTLHDYKLDFFPGSSGNDPFKDGISAQDIQTKNINSYSDLNDNPPHHLGFDVEEMPVS